MKAELGWDEGNGAFSSSKSYSAYINKDSKHEL